MFRNLEVKIMTSPIIKKAIAPFSNRKGIDDGTTETVRGVAKFIPLIFFIGVILTVVGFISGFWATAWTKFQTTLAQLNGFLTP